MGVASVGWVTPSGVNLPTHRDKRRMRGGKLPAQFVPREVSSITATAVGGAREPSHRYLASRITLRQGPYGCPTLLSVFAVGRQARYRQIVEKHLGDVDQ
jgi:hypothetical protein